MGLTCSVRNSSSTSKVCKAAAKEGEYCDFETLCKSYLHCRKNKCIKYGSVKNNENPGEENPNLCESHYMNRGICAEGPKLDGDIFVDHNEDICDYTNGEKRNAQCGYHKDGKAICRAGEGDLESEWIVFRHYLDQKPECNSYVSPMSMCDYAEKQLGRTYLRAGIAYYQLNQFVDIQGNAECVKKHNNPKYFEMLKKYYGETSTQ